MHLYLSQHWRIVPGRNISKLTHRFQVLLDEGAELPLEFVTPWNEVQPEKFDTIPDHIKLCVEKEFGQSLDRLVVSFSKTEALRAVNLPWILVNHVVYLDQPLTDVEWKRVIAEYIHRQRLVSLSD